MPDLLGGTPLIGSFDSQSVRRAEAAWTTCSHLTFCRSILKFLLITHPTPRQKKEPRAWCPGLIMI
jgi:hypothetical protein